MSTDLYIELDGLFYEVKNSPAGTAGPAGRSVSLVEGISRISRDARLVTDFGESIAQLLTLNVSPKYAPVVARKEVQESGQFDGPVHIIPHWQRKKTKGTSDILFTALPVSTFQRYMDSVKNLDASLLIFPLYAVLYGVIKRKSNRGVTGVVFQHGRTADLVIGSKRRIYHASRIVAFDETPEQITTLWANVRNEVKAVEEEEGIRIERLISLTWITTHDPPEFDWDEFELWPLPGEEVAFEGKTYQVSFPAAIRMTPPRLSVSGAIEKLCFHSRKMMPALAGLLLILLCLTVGGHFYLKNKTDQLMHQLHQVKAGLKNQREQLSTVITPVNYDQVFTFLKDLERCTRVPSFREVVNHISSLLPKGAEVQSLKTTYHHWGVELEVTVRARLPFDQAHRAYQRFLNGMSRLGFAIEEAKFNTSIQESEFLARLKKKI